MRKETLIIFTLASVLSLGIVGALHYFYLQSKIQTPTPTVTHSQPATGTVETERPTKRQVVHRTATPIKCTKADGSIFWTNASRWSTQT